jgi:type IV fimbrial biogenesis protein FimT
MYTLNTVARKSQGAFTLIELLITITVLGVLMAIALPNLQSFVVSNRLSSDVNGFLGLINYARSEAIARSQDVVICPKANAAITCQDSQFWGEYEIQAFVDINGNGERNAGDVLLKTLPATDVSGTSRRFTRTAGVGIIKFGAVGLSQTSHRFDIFAIKAGDLDYEARYGRTVCISRPGRPRVTPLLTNACDGF